MSGNFQREFKHRTIPATEWSTTTWATEAAQKCQLKLTRDAPRINLTARYIKNHKCGKPPRQPPPPVESPIELPAPEPTPADAQGTLRALRAKADSHEAAEQDMQRQIAELEKQLAEHRAKESEPNTKNANSSLSDELSLIHI